MVHGSHVGISICSFEPSSNSRILSVRDKSAHQLLGLGKSCSWGGLKAFCFGSSAETLQNCQRSGCPAPSRGTMVLSSLSLWHSCHGATFFRKSRSLEHNPAAFFSLLPVKQQGLPYINFLIFSEIWYYSLLPIRCSISIFFPSAFSTPWKSLMFFFLSWAEKSARWMTCRMESLKKARIRQNIWF